MTGPIAARDAAVEEAEARRQHAPADVAPELYGGTDESVARSE